MGNLEKLGILVMVILVVVVGVVAITPQERVTAAFKSDAPTDGTVEPLPPPPAPATQKPNRKPWPDDIAPVKKRNTVSPMRSADPASRRDGGRPATKPQGVRSSTYTVKDGDSLFSIALKELGDGARWNEIVELNPALDPGDLRKDDVLVLPRAGAPTPAPRTAPPVRTYKVQKGDTLSGIASKLLGSATKWRALLDANRKLMDAPEDLREGMLLTLPSTARTSSGAAAKTASTDTAIAASGRTYTVRSGDSLSRIARQQLGKEGRWKEIQRLNHDVLRGGTALTPGTTLRLPE